MNRHAGEEPGDLDEDLGAIVLQETLVAGGLVVLPDAVGHRQADVPLPMGVVGHPLSVAEIQELRRGFVAPVAAGLPGEHRAVKAVGPSQIPRGGQPAVAVQQKTAGEFRSAHRQQRIDVELVPEDVPAIALAVQAHARAGRHRGRCRRRRTTCSTWKMCRFSASACSNPTSRPMPNRCHKSPPHRRCPSRRSSNLPARAIRLSDIQRSGGDRAVARGRHGDGLLDSHRDAGRR